MSSNYEYIRANIVGKKKAFNGKGALTTTINRVRGLVRTLSTSEIEKLRKQILDKITVAELKDYLNKRFSTLKKERLAQIQRVKEQGRKAKNEIELEKKRTELANKIANEETDNKESTHGAISDSEEDYQHRKNKKKGQTIYKESSISSTTWLSKDPYTPPPMEE